MKTNNETLKVKVLKYANDGNTIVKPYKELTPVQNLDGYFTYLFEEVYSTKYFGVVIECRGLFVEIGIHREDQLQKLNDITQATEYREGYPDKWKIMQRPDLLIIKVNELLGNDASEPIAKRAKYDEDKRAAEEQKQNERQNAAAIKQEEEIKKSEILRQELKQGKATTYAELLKAMELLKYNLHPRTKGTLLKQVQTQEISTTSGHFIKQTSSETAQSIMRTVAKFAGV